MTVGPISLFDCVKSNQPSDCEYFSFEDFVILMSAYAADVFAAKGDAPLVCFTDFKNGRRSKVNATQSAMVVLDVDDHVTIDEIDAVLTEYGVQALLCNTASHRSDHHKFRVFVPLAATADYDRHVLAWHVINHALADGKADPSKIGCESMFFVPGQYPEAPSVFREYDGFSLSAGDWIKMVGTEQDVLKLAGKAGRRSPKSVSRDRPTANAAVANLSDADLDLSRSRLVTDRALDNYRMPNGSYHHARFALMLSMAGRASRLNLMPSPSDLLMLFNQIDLQDGGYYQSQDHQRALLAEAQKALSQT